MCRHASWLLTVMTVGVALALGACGNGDGSGGDTTPVDAAGDQVHGDADASGSDAATDDGGGPETPADLPDAADGGGDTSDGSDGGGPDVAQTGAPPTGFSLTAGAGALESANYRLDLWVGAALPMATRKSTNYTLRLGPAAPVPR